MMKSNDLKSHIKTLATLPKTVRPVISCYLTVEKGQVLDKTAYESQLAPILRLLSGDDRNSVKRALEPVDNYLKNELSTDSRGVAIFSRWGEGEDSFFLALQFKVPLKNWITVDSTPNIFHLVELKDVFHRYIVVITTRDSSRILEVNVGSVTRELWVKHPELRKRMGQEWTKIYYQNHAREQGARFIAEKIKIIEKLMSESGNTNLILAGQPLFISEIRDHLPMHFLSNLVYLPHYANSTDTSDVVHAAIADFIRTEEESSHYSVELLSHEIQTGGLAVAGAVNCLKSLREDRVDTLIMLKDFALGKGRVCERCESIFIDGSSLENCPACAHPSLNTIDMKEELVRIAEQFGAEIEMVDHHEVLQRLEGVGCLLRF